MNAKTLRQWATQITTGIGALLASGAFTAIITHQVSWIQGLPALIAAAVGVFWPERADMPAAVQATVSAVIPAVQSTVSSIESLVEAYQIGAKHGAASVVPPVAPVTVLTPPSPPAS